MAQIIDFGQEVAIEVANRLRIGEIGIMPTDTIYGFAAAATEENARRLAEIKKRPEEKAFITLMTKEDALSSFSVPSEIAEIWPAPLTAIVAASDGTRAIRVPDDWFLSLVLPISGPIFSTSANISGESSILAFDKLYEAFADTVDFIVKAPSSTGRKASTLVDATKKPFKVIRQGDFVLNL